MTPAIRLLELSKNAYQVHQYDHESSEHSYGLEAAEKLDVPAARIFKTLIIRLNNRNLAVAVIPVAATLSMKRFARAAGARKAGLADKSDAERATGYILGGISPLGQKKQLTTIVDDSAEAHPSIFVSAGRRGLEIELKPADLVLMTRGRYACVCQ